MKTIVFAAVVIIGAAARCFGAGDPVSSVTKDEKRETTTFQRDGKTILKIVVYKSSDPNRRLVRQAVVFGGSEVLDISDFGGKRVFEILPKTNLSVSILQDASTGALEGVMLRDRSVGIIEHFEAKDSRLIPISGKDLEYQRAVTKDVGGLFSDFINKKTTPKAFVERALELPKRYKNKSREQDAQGNHGATVPQSSATREEQ